MGTKILVVEDEGIIAKDIQDRMRRAGYDVPGIANSSDEAIRQIEETRPDVVLMDIRIRGPRDGIETAEIVKSIYRLPVIFLTSYADNETLQRAKATDPFGYITKPITSTTNLSAAIEMALNRHRIETELVVKSAQVETASRENSKFLAGLSHEIRTPLNILLGMNELLLETNLTSLQRKYLDVSRRAGGNLQRLVDDILDLAKAESGCLELEQTPFDLLDLASSTLDMIRLQAQDKNLRFTLQLIPGVPRKVSGDPIRLRQVLLNLLSNAVKFTPAGEIALGIKPLPPLPGRVEIEVRDTGIGIAQDRLEAIFKDFVQADSSTTRRFGGTGLGLGICRKLVSLMNGTIQVESELGKGSRFWFDVELGVLSE